MDQNHIYEEYGDFIFKYLFTLTNDHHCAEELAQETFYQAIKSIHTYRNDGKAKLSTWLCAIAKNVWLQEVNRESKKRRLVESLGRQNSVQRDLEEAYIESEDVVGFFKNAQRLSETKREVVYLRLLGDLSFREIGDVFEKTENWARVTYYRAKLELRKGEKSDES